MQTLRYFCSFYKPYKGTFFLDLLCASILSIIDLSYPLIFNWCVSGLFTQGSSLILSVLPWLAGGMILMYVIKAACRYYVTCQGHIMGAQMETDMRQLLFDQLQRLSFAYYDRSNTGTMMSRVVSDLFDISELAHHGPENLFISIIKLAGSFAIMSILNWKLSLALFAVVAVMLIFSKIQNERMEATFMDNRKKIAEVNASLMDSLEGVRVVQSFANEKIETKKFEKSNKRFLESKKANYRAMGTYYSGNHFFQGMLYVTVLGVGGYLCAAGEMSASELATFALYVNVFVSPLEILIEFTEMFQKGFSGFRRFEEVMKEIPDIREKEDAKPLKDPKGTITFDHVSFAYEDDEPVLQDISLTIDAGENIALAGPSGSGKTTFCSLIPRFYDVTGGSVKIDGQDIRDLSLESLRGSIGVVQQDIYLFDGTIAENIRYGKQDATDEEVLEAAKKANLFEFIRSLPDGLETRVGEKGTRLSGGQKQRISIARVFLKNPPIVILDEATSALDNESEHIVQQSLAALAKNRTCITIAHRLSTIRNADEIYMIAEQGIAEKGSHKELMKKNGLYASYYQLQFDRENRQ